MVYNFPIIAEQNMHYMMQSHSYRACRDGSSGAGDFVWRNVIQIYDTTKKFVILGIIAGALYFLIGSGLGPLLLGLGYIGAAFLTALGIFKKGLVEEVNKGRHIFRDKKYEALMTTKLSRYDRFKRKISDCLWDTIFNKCKEENSASIEPSTYSEGDPATCDQSMPSANCEPIERNKRAELEVSLPPYKEMTVGELYQKLYDKQIYKDLWPEDLKI